MISGITSIPLFLNEQKVDGPLKQRSYVDNKKSFFVLKGVTDIFISVLFLLFIFSWLFVIIAFVIILDSKGPIFFVQRRVGKAGKSFLCFKFRTMLINPEADIKRADTHDSRITKFGKILRAYNIDELPQFLNELFGQMSIVGPRPHMHSDCAAFSKCLPGYKFRTFVKPGITGLAQARGYHGPVTDARLFEKRFELDAFYVRNASIQLDIWIIRATLLRRIQLLFNKL